MHGLQFCYYLFVYDVCLSVSRMKLCEMKIRGVIQSRLWITGGQKCVSVEDSAGLQLVTQNLQDGNKGLGKDWVYKLLQLNAS